MFQRRGGEEVVFPCPTAAVESSSHSTWWKEQEREWRKSNMAKRPQGGKEAMVLPERVAGSNSLVSAAAGRLISQAKPPQSCACRALKEASTGRDGQG